MKSNGAELRIESVTKKFGGITAVNDVNVYVEPGEIHGIIGPNGAGKTTLFNLITGIYMPTEGNIYLNGTSLVGMPPHEISLAGVARTFQNIRLFNELSAYQNIITACHSSVDYNLIQGCLRTKKYREQESKIEKIAEEALKRVDLWELRDTVASNLPYGRQRRLEIARALVTKPKLLLLDEPAAGMNEEESYRLSEFIKAIRKDYDITVVIIDHHMDVIMDTCDNITVFNFGTKLAEGKPQDIQSNQAVIEAYLGRSEE